MTKLYTNQTGSEQWTNIELRVSAQENTETTEDLSVVTTQSSLPISFWAIISVTYFLMLSFLLLPKWQLKKIILKQYQRLLRFNLMLSSRQWYKHWRKQQHCLSLAEQSSVCPGRLERRIFQLCLPSANCILQLWFLSAVKEESQ